MSEVLKQNAEKLRKELDKATALVGSTETMVINEIFDELLGVAEAEIDLVIKDLCGLVADLYHQHEEIVKEKEAEIQSEKETVQLLLEALEYLNESYEEKEAEIHEDL